MIFIAVLLGLANSEWRVANGNPYSLFATRHSRLYPRHIELRLLAGAVAAQRALLTNRIGTLEDPVLPGGEAGKDFRFHGLRTDEAEICFHAGETVGGEGGALLEEHAHLVVPVDVVDREGDEAEFFGRFGVDGLADLRFGAIEIGGIGLKSRLQPRDAMAHRIGPEIHG